MRQISDDVSAGTRFEPLTDQRIARGYDFSITLDEQSVHVRVHVRAPAYQRCRNQSSRAKRFVQSARTGEPRQSKKRVEAKIERALRGRTSGHEIAIRLDGDSEGAR